VRLEDRFEGARELWDALGAALALEITEPDVSADAPVSSAQVAGDDGEIHVTWDEPAPSADVAAAESADGESPPSSDVPSSGPPSLTLPIALSRRRGSGTSPTHITEETT
jgi:hypothetical protein